MNYYIADMHFGHANVLKFDSRPWESVEEMENALVERWNAKVGKSDTVYILGDFCWQKEPEWIRILNRLNGGKVLIVGNHDIHGSATLRKMFQDVKEYKEIKDNGRFVVLSHYPIPCFKNHFYGAYHLYGHVHDTFEHRVMLVTKNLLVKMHSCMCQMYNVGCMMPYMDYTPRTLDEIIAGAEEYEKGENEHRISG
jgi:calcineurin-like phosphoesterase family protein